MTSQTVVPDAPKVFKVHLLDMGAKKYGDCLLCEIGEKVILIDGGHLGDQVRSDPGYPSIPEQLEEVLGKPAPWHVDLLVVTHTHSDHIGCLPNLVSNGQLTCSWALVADEALGWGEVEGADGPALSEAPQPVQEVFALLREEPPSFANREELEAFASDAVKMRDRYTAMLKTLKQSGAKVVRYGRDSTTALVKAFKDTGLEILGPTREHLKTCALQIAALGRDAVDALAARLEQDASLDVAALYGGLRQRRVGALEADSESFEVSAAINDQSLVLAFGTGDRKVLLTGDMQFGGPGVEGLGASMKALRQRILSQGPYGMVKLAHHGARNAVDAGVLTESGARLFIISGGYGSSQHPHRDTLETLKAALPGITWYRTDRNGLISVDLGGQELEVEWVRGEANETVKNKDAQDFLAEAEPASEPATPIPVAPGPVVVRRATTGVPGEFVEVITRVPHHRTRVVITIEVEPPDEMEAAVPPQPVEQGIGGEDQPRPQPVPAAGRAGRILLGGGRKLPPLLFATDPTALAANIGREEARAVVESLESSGHEVVFENFRRMGSGQARVVVRTALTSRVQGVVLVGGYDVVPPESVDVLSAAHRRAVDPRYDPDRFLVWSDDFYGDLDDSGLPELPVSRVPDARSWQLLQTALAAPRILAPRSRAGLRNLKRPFAQEVFADLPGDAELLVSHPTTAGSITPDYFAADAIYLVLHGRPTNGRSFLGATEAEELVEAIDHRNLRASPGAVVFSGCCWGALIVETTAWTHRPGDGFAPRSPEASLALGFLAAGANAFVGCTGVHYSPRLAPFNYASGPIHRAFWKHLIVDGLAPAAALLQAKKSYMKGIPYPNPIPGEDPGAAAAAVEKKLLAQFTCLGLGW